MQRYHLTDMLTLRQVSRTSWITTSFHSQTCALPIFINYPYDVLNSIGMDNIGKISVVKISPTINENVCNTTLNEVLEDPDYSVDDALQELQDAVDMEQEE